MIQTTEKVAKAGPITIKAYFDPTVPNMGLEKYGLSLWDGVFHEEQLAQVGEGGHKRFVTGLDENAPEVKALPEELRISRVKEIRKTVAFLERENMLNKIPQKIVEDLEDTDSKPFWDRVKKYRPDNTELWSGLSLRIGNEPITLDLADPVDLIKYHAIMAGGFSLVASSYEEARSRAVAPKFYLDRYEETASTVTELKKLKNKALTELQTLFDTNQTKLFYVAKVTDMDSSRYRKSTPNDVIYDNLDKYINGEGIEKSKKRAAQTFLDNSRQDMETLKLRSLIKDATFYKFIGLKSDGFIYHLKSNTNIGRNPSDALLYLQNPLNDQVLDTIMKEVERLWQ